jgi:hypothetical protein
MHRVLANPTGWWLSHPSENGHQIIGLIWFNRKDDDQPLLVGGFNPSEKYDFVSWCYYSPWKVIKFMFQTTNQPFMIVN